MKISKHVSYEEVIDSDRAIAKGIKNEPNTIQLLFITEAATDVIDPMCERLGVPIGFNSIFRCSALNKVTPGASDTSQHTALNGAAFDINGRKYAKITNKDVFDDLYLHGDFDQLIWEDGSDIEPAWVHVSYHKGHNRHQVLRKKNAQYYTVAKLWYKLDNK